MLYLFTKKTKNFQKNIVGLFSLTTYKVGESMETIVEQSLKEEALDEVVR